MNSINISVDVCVPFDVYNFCLVNQLDLRNYINMLLCVNSVNHMLSNHSLFLNFYNNSPELFKELINESE